MANTINGFGQRPYRSCLKGARAGAEQARLSVKFDLEATIVYRLDETYYSSAVGATEEMPAVHYPSPQIGRLVQLRRIARHLPRLQESDASRDHRPIFKITQSGFCADYFTINRAGQEKAVRSVETFFSEGKKKTGFKYFPRSIQPKEDANIKAAIGILASDLQNERKRYRELQILRGMMQ